MASSIKSAAVAEACASAGGRTMSEAKREVWVLEAHDTPAQKYQPAFFRSEKEALETALDGEVPVRYVPEATAEASGRATEQLLLNLLARIHRDGGQCVHKVGLAQACADADTQVVRQQFAIAHDSQIRNAVAELLALVSWSECGAPVRSAVYRVRKLLDAPPQPSPIGGTENG